MLNVGTCKLHSVQQVQMALVILLRRMLYTGVLALISTYKCAVPLGIIQLASKAGLRIYKASCPPLASPRIRLTLHVPPSVSTQATLRHFPWQAGFRGHLPMTGVLSSAQENGMLLTASLHRQWDALNSILTQTPSTFPGPHNYERAKLVSNFPASTLSCPSLLLLE